MHEGDHGIMDHTHEELDKKFGHSQPEHHNDHHHHNHPPQSSDRWIKVSAGIVVILLIGLFIVYKLL